MKDTKKFTYWDPGDKQPIKRPKGCQYYNEYGCRWEVEESAPRHWLLLQRRWPKSFTTMKEKPKDDCKPCKCEKILVELLKQTRIDHDTFGKPLIRFGSFFPTIDNPKLNRQLMRLRKKHDDKSRTNIR